MSLIDENGQILSDVHVADTWQEWNVQLSNGWGGTYKGDTVAVNFELAPTVAGEPSVLDITFPTRLEFKLPSHFDMWQGWKTVLDAIPVLTVLVEGRDANEPYDSFNHVTFTSDDAIGSKKAWTARIVFSGNPAQAENMIYVTNALAGKSSALIQVVFSEVWTTYQAWQYSASTQNCNGQSSGITINWPWVPLLCQISQRTVPSPYGLNFDWTPSATGTASFTWPTGVIASTDQNGGIVQIWTKTGTETLTLWKSFTATLAGPPTTVTQTIGTVPTGAGGNSGGSMDLCTLPVIGWLCGKTWGIANWTLLILGLIGFIILLGILAVVFRRRTGRHSAGN